MANETKSPAVEWVDERPPERLRLFLHDGKVSRLWYFAVVAPGPHEIIYVRERSTADAELERLRQEIRNLKRFLSEWQNQAERVGQVLGCSSVDIEERVRAVVATPKEPSERAIAVAQEIHDRIRASVSNWESFTVEQAAAIIDRHFQPEQEAGKATERDLLRKIYEAAIDLTYHCREIYRTKKILITGLPELIHAMRAYDHAWDKSTVPTVPTATESIAYPEVSLDTWPLYDVLHKLIEWAEHLGDTHNCDCHGYEERSFIIPAARLHAAASASATESDASLLRDAVTAERERIRLAVEAIQDGSPVERARNIAEYRNAVLAIIEAAEK